MLFKCDNDNDDGVGVGVNGGVRRRDDEDDEDNNRLLFSITKVAPCCAFADDDPVDPDYEAILSNELIFSYCSSLKSNKDDKL